jgi:phosphoribosyl 1,2-cyclic phosphate phosphodiesterase
MKVVVLGSGTSSGVPTIGCPCAVCHSPDPRDNRTRPSILIERDGRNIVIDTTPDFRAQVLREHVGHVDAILFTHAHADHILGFDDIRPFNGIQRAKIPVYASEETLDSLRRIFTYVFDNVNRNTFIPKIDTHDHRGEPFELFGLKVQPIPLWHGDDPIYGYRIGQFAWMFSSWTPCATGRIPRTPQWKTRFAILHDCNPNGPTSRTSATIFRTPPPKPLCRITSAWPTTVCRSRWANNGGPASLAAA